MCYFHYTVKVCTVKESTSTSSRSNTGANSAASKLGTRSDFLLGYTSAGEAEPTTVARGPQYRLSYCETHLKAGHA